MTAPKPTDIDAIDALLDERDALAAEVERLRAIIGNARYAIRNDQEAIALAHLDGNGLDPGVADDMRTDLEAAIARAEKAEALRADMRHAIDAIDVRYRVGMPEFSAEDVDDAIARARALLGGER